MVLLHLNCYVANLSTSFKISLSHQAVYYYLLDNPVSGPSFVPTVIAALHPSNKIVICPFLRTKNSLHKVKLSHFQVQSVKDGGGTGAE